MPKEKLLRVAGLPAVQALFATASSRVERLFFVPQLRAEMSDYCGVLGRARKPYRQVGTEELTKVAGTVLHGGVVAIARPKPVRTFEAGEVAHWASDGKLLVVLDGIGNPHNLGAIARTAAFFGVPRLVLSNHPEQALPSDASYRVAEGGLDRLEVYRSVNFLRDLEAIRRSYLLVGAAAEGGQPLPDVAKSKRPIALVLGNEEHGFPVATAKACEALVTVVGSGAVQSLNVAATTAIFIHALTSNRS